MRLKLSHTYILRQSGYPISLGKWGANSLAFLSKISRRCGCRIHREEKARIRTIREVIALLKQADSQTAVTYHFIRKLCDSGCIKSIRAGKKILINYDELLAYLNLDIDEAC